MWGYTRTCGRVTDQYVGLNLTLPQVQKRLEGILCPDVGLYTNLREGYRSICRIEFDPPAGSEAVGGHFVP